MDTPSRETSDQICRALGDAVIRLWSSLPKDIQHRLFEEALTARSSDMRQQLAQFLHHRHARTQAGAAARAIIEPDSLGG